MRVSCTVPAVAWQREVPFHPFRPARVGAQPRYSGDVWNISVAVSRIHHSSADRVAADVTVNIACWRVNDLLGYGVDMLDRGVGDP